MITVQFVDLSKTIDVTWGFVLDIATLSDIVNGFCEDWDKDSITISGKSVDEEMFNLQACELPRKRLQNGESYLVIEKHK